jgi:hypothetical protein
MNIISHVVYPVLFAQSVNIYRIQSHKTPFFNKKHLLLIGTCGALPDILSPHLGLQDRYNSFWHSIWFLLLAVIAALILARIIPQHRRPIFFCSFAVAFHHFCDMIAGGINLFGPFGRHVLGKYYIPFQYWIPFDMAGILFLAVSFIYSVCSVRARPLILVSGCALALCGTGITFSAFDIEAFLTERIPEPKIDSAQLENAQRNWNNLLTKWQAGAFEPVSDEYNEDMQKALTPQFQKQFFEQMKSVYGDYRGLKFVEAIGPRFHFPRMIFYRFRGAFSKMPQQPEIDIVFDNNGKISSFMFRDKWKNTIM